MKNEAVAHGGLGSQRCEDGGNLRDTVHACAHRAPLHWQRRRGRLHAPTVSRDPAPGWPTLLDEDGYAVSSPPWALRSMLAGHFCLVLEFGHGHCLEGGDQIESSTVLRSLNARLEYDK